MHTGKNVYCRGLGQIKILKILFYEALPRSIKLSQKYLGGGPQLKLCIQAVL
jgi:hypothetical protein